MIAPKTVDEAPRLWCGVKRSPVKAAPRASQPQRRACRSEPLLKPLRLAAPVARPDRTRKSQVFRLPCLKAFKAPEKGSCPSKSGSELCGGRELDSNPRPSPRLSRGLQGGRPIEA